MKMWSKCAGNAQSLEEYVDPSGVKAPIGPRPTYCQGFKIPVRHYTR